MATNRLYIACTITKRYICVGKLMYGRWEFGNFCLLSDFYDNVSVTKTEIGYENDDDFYNNHILNGENFNTENIWITHD